jgi:alanine racemase
MTALPRAQIHLANIVHNWRAIDALHPAATTAAVVKANGYGLGGIQVARALQKAGCSSFFVAWMEEGAELRKALGAGSRIFVLNGPAAGQVKTFLTLGLTAVLSTEHQLKAWNGAPKGTCALHFNTGMNRLGLPWKIVDSDAAALRQLEPVLIMSHLACAEEPSHPMNEAQRAAFDHVCAAFPDTPASLANSAGTYLGRTYGYDLTRPGIALYGGTTPPPRLDLKHAVTLDAEIISLSSVKAGGTVGYGATFKLTRETLLATCGLGYADGFPRAGSGQLLGYYDGIACPVAGRISMDLITLDVTAAGGKIKAGARIEFLGAHAKLEEQAARCGTLGYELLTGLSNRVQRTFK